MLVVDMVGVEFVCVCAVGSVCVCGGGGVGILVDQILSFFLPPPLSLSLSLSQMMASFRLNRLHISICGVFGMGGGGGGHALGLFILSSFLSLSLSLEDGSIKTEYFLFPVTFVYVCVYVGWGEGDTNYMIMV